MKYKCLVLDHDDTVVNSTATIHYPCFVEYLGKYFPKYCDTYTLKDYFIKNFHPGIIELFTDEIGLSEEQLAHEEAYWREYVKEHIPTAYEGISEVISEFKSRGGIIVVDSHSYTGYIERDYKHNNLPFPDLIYGWDIPKDQRKPSPYTLFDIMKRFDLKPSELIVVDDLKPGYDMAKGAGVDFAAAGWAYDVPEIADFMKTNCDYYLQSIKDLDRILFR